MDLLVKLYDLPPLAPAMERVVAAGIRIHRPIAPERAAVMRWVTEHFNERWAGEVAMSFAGQPVSCFVALDQQSDIVGFACYNSTFKGFFGPTGVETSQRGNGIGTALLLRSLHALHDDGHAYGIIGWSSLDEFYKTTVGAIPIPDSEPGPYGGRIRIPD